MKQMKQMKWKREGEKPIIAINTLKKYGITFGGKQNDRMDETES